MQLAGIKQIGRASTVKIVRSKWVCKLLFHLQVSININAQLDRLSHVFLYNYIARPYPHSLETYRFPSTPHNPQRN